MGIKPDCETKLLSDEPVDKDEFGSHERVAEAIYHLISNGDGGKTIALVGSWGSGKSTVIKILERKVKENEGKGVNKLAVFVFDAWAHQGDPLRRSFLERLIEFLKEKRWLGEKTCNDLKDRLTHRKEETKIRTTPILTFWGKLLAVSIVLLPLGSALVSSSRWPSIGFKIGLFLSLAPVLIFLTVSLLAWIKRARLWIEKFLRRSIDNRLENSTEDISGLFFQRTQEVQHILSVRVPDPTSVEFEEIFAKTMGEALKDESRRLVIVIDNLDRLDVEESRMVWATMRTFFELDRNATWTKRMWLIVPHDPSILQRLWGSGNEKELPNAFAAKTFQIHFHVPPPTLSDWGRYLENCLRQALPQHESEFGIIKRMFRLKPKMVSSVLTPRDIKRFVNRLVSLHSQWCSDIPLPFQALYVLYEEEITPEKLVQGNFMDSQILEVIGETKGEWQKHLAALYFNVHPNKALHILIGRDVEKALTEGDVERLKEFVKIPGLWDVVEETIDRLRGDWVKESQKIDPQQIGLATIPLASVPETPPHLLSLMSDALLEAKGWDKLGERGSEGIELLLDRIEDEKKRKIMQHLLNSLSEVKPKKETLSDWVRGVFRLVRKASNLGMESELEGFGINGEASDYLEVVKELAAKGDEVKPFAKYFIPKVSVEEVFKELASGISQRTDRWSDIVNFLLNVPIFANAEAEKWQTVFEPIRQKLENQQTQLEDVKELVKSLIFLIDHTPTEPLSKSLLDSLKNNGQLFHHLYQAHSMNNQEFIAWVLVALTEVTPIPLHWSPPYWGNVSSGFNIYNQILDSPQSYPQVLQEFALICLQRVKKRRDYFDRLIGLGSHERFGSWIRVTFQKMVEDIDKSLDFFSPESVLEHYSSLKEILPEEKMKELVSALMRKKGLAQKIIERRFDLRLDKIYLSVLGDCAEEDWQSYTDFLRKSLHQVQKEEWISCLKELKPAIQLVANLVERGVSLNLGLQFSDALLEHAKLAFEGLEGRSFPEEFIGVWKYLPHAIDESQKKVWGKNLRDEFLSKAPERNSSLFLKLYGDALLELGELEERADELVRRVFKEFMERCDETELEWMEKAIKKVWEKTDEGTRNDFVQRLKERFEKVETSERAKEILREVLSKISRQL